MNVLFLVGVPPLSYPVSFSALPIYVHFSNTVKKPSKWNDKEVRSETILIFCRPKSLDKTLTES